MRDMQHEISRLLHFARRKGLIEPEDEVYAANRLLDVEKCVLEQVDEALGWEAGGCADGDFLLQRSHGDGRGECLSAHGAVHAAGHRVVDEIAKESNVAVLFLFLEKIRKHTFIFYGIIVLGNLERSSRGRRPIGWFM